MNEIYTMKHQIWPSTKQQCNGGDRIKAVADSINAVDDELNIIHYEYQQ